jgi:hypothetical protein
MSLSQSQSLPASQPTSTFTSTANSRTGSPPLTEVEEPDYDDILTGLSLVEEEASVGGQGSSRRRRDKLGAEADAEPVSVYPLAGVDPPPPITSSAAAAAAEQSDEASFIGLPVMDMGPPPGEPGDYDNIDELPPSRSDTLRSNLTLAEPQPPASEDEDVVSLGGEDEEGFGFDAEPSNARVDTASYLEPRPKRVTEVFDGLKLADVTVECVCKALQSLGMSEHCAAFRRDQVRRLPCVFGRNAAMQRSVISKLPLSSPLFEIMPQVDGRTLMNLNEAYFESVLGVKNPAQRDDMLTMGISGGEEPLCASCGSFVCSSVSRPCAFLASQLLVFPPVFPVPPK